MMILSLLLALAAPRTLHVDVSAPPGGDGNSWTGALRDLQDALDEARLDPEVIAIHVAAGTYLPDRGTLDPDLGFELVEGVELLGGFPTGGGTLADRDSDLHEVILSGDLLGDDGPPDLGGWILGATENTRHLVRGVNLSAATLVDGVTVRSGRAPAVAAGGGMRIVGGAPRLRDIHFLRSYASFQGGGLALVDSTATVSECSFTENRADTWGAGAAIVGPAAATFVDSRFHANFGGSGSGLAIVPSTFQGTDGSASIVRRCLFTDNTGVVGATAGGGLFALESTPRVIACEFENNMSNGGGGLFVQRGAARVERCLFRGNRGAGDGGGAITVVDFAGTSAGTTEIVSCALVGNAGAVLSVGSHVRLLHCTLAHNLLSGPPLFWPAVFGQSADFELLGCIVWGNSPMGSFGDERDHLVSFDFNPSTFLVDHSIVEDWAAVLPGNGTDLAPRFMDPRGADGEVASTEDNDYRLSLSSPARDTGDNTLLPSLPHRDVQGRPRLRDGDFDGVRILDLGAYEAAPLLPVTHRRWP